MTNKEITEELQGQRDAITANKNRIDKLASKSHVPQRIPSREQIIYWVWLEKRARRDFGFKFVGWITAGLTILVLVGLGIKELIELFQASGITVSSAWL